MEEKRRMEENKKLVEQAKILLAGIPVEIQVVLLESPNCRTSKVFANIVADAIKIRTEQIMSILDRFEGLEGKKGYGSREVICGGRS